ncbi:MAG: hypothetical protein DWC10_00295 [Candidatus Poseidoniales archaeon]|nr:MAG: hypothetical protein DWC10_00295 [Candidatus Poseidoniales archaeon]
MEVSSEADSEDEASSSTRTFHPAWALFLGFLLAFSEMAFRLITGRGVVDSIWPHAVRSLEWTLVLRSSMELTLSLMLLATAAAYGLRRWKMERHERTEVDIALAAVTGLLTGLISLHLLLDWAYLRGAFLLLPTLYGWLLLCLLLAWGGAPTWRTLDDPRVSWPRISHLLGVFFAAWLVMPGIPALVGIAPSPPESPKLGYGSTPGPYDTIQFASPYSMPEEVVAVRGDLEDDVTFSVHLTLPQLPEDTPVTHLPLAVLLHGFGYPDVDAYQGWITHLAAKGMAVAFLQYPSDLRPEGYEAFIEQERDGMSDFLQHTYRDMAIRAAIDHLDTMLLSTQRDPRVDAHLGNVTVDPSTLWTGGHSLGAAYTFITLDDVLSRGWGQHALVVALEAPASRPMQAALQPTLSPLPNETLVQIGVSQDDMSVGMCPGAFHQQMFTMLPTERNQLLEVQTDKYGFPRLVASHYLQTDPARDVLSDWSFYRRIDAQADYLVAHARNDTFTANWAYQYMTDETMLTGMGSWSDGTPVLPLKLHHDAIESTPFLSCV